MKKITELISINSVQIRSCS